ncbi:MAG: flavodoxin family protein [Spirochaetaceae bacterium]|jgi:flavodoxin|nr:flavodoxin family protein [Spirochaetaceae bacterium]
MDTGTEHKEGTGLIVYSSRTGNTRRLAEGIHRGLTDALGWEPRLAAVEENPDPAGAEWILAGFWVDRGTADQKILEFLKTLGGRRVGLFGTLGASPESKHAGDVRQRVQTLASEKNTLLGCFLCQGKIDPELTGHFKNLPPDNPHGMTPERMQRHLEAAKHPDETDISAGVRACLSMVKSLLPEGAA